MPLISLFTSNFKPIGNSFSGRRFPSNDFDYTIIPNNDLTYIFIPDNDIFNTFILNNDVQYALIPDNDIINVVIPNNVVYKLIPNSDSTYTLIPNNDVTYSLLQPSPTPTPTPTQTITPTQTPTPSITTTITPTSSITPTPSSTLTPTPSVTLTPTPSSTPPVSNCDTFTFIGYNSTTTTNSATNDGSGGWDSSAYSTETYTNPVSVTFQTSSNGNYLMGGFSYNPTGNPTTYLNTTFGLYVQPNFLEIYENGGQATVPGGMVNTSSDVWKVEYDGIYVKYYKNESLIYTSSNTVTQPLHIFFPLLTANEGVTNVCVVESLTPTQLITNSDFTNDSTGWSATGGFGTYSYTSSNQVAILDNVLYFTYVSRTVSQTVDVSSYTSLAKSYVGVVNIRHREKGDNGLYTQIDKYTFTIIYKNSGGGTVITKTTGNVNAPQYFTDVSLTLNRSEIPLTFDTITSAVVQITGIDTGYWNGNHGPLVDYLTLTVN